MMNMRKTITDILKPLGVPFAYGTIEDKGVYPFCTFSYTEIPTDYSDDEEEANLYLVAINIFCKSDINYSKTQAAIIKAMKEAGFKKQATPAVQIIESENMYNQPLAFSYYEYF